jgi:hypothetical protein
VAGTLIFVGFLAARLELRSAVAVPSARPPLETDVLSAMR